MYLTTREKEFLFVAMAAKLAKERMEKGLKLNYPETIAYITFEIMEQARIGKMKITELEDYGKTILSEEDVMEGIPHMINRIDIEATFPDGTKLVVLYNPIQPKHKKKNEEEHKKESQLKVKQIENQREGQKKTQRRRPQS